MDHVIALAGKCKYTDGHDSQLVCPPLTCSTTRADDVRLIIPIIGQDVRETWLPDLHDDS